MGTTTKFGFPFPDATDLVRQAPAQFEDLADAIEATFTGTVLQVVHASTSTQVTNSTNTYADTGLTATITPKATTSRILVLVNQQSVIASNGGGIRILRDATTIMEPVADGTGPFELQASTSQRVSISLVDSPNTIGATTYKTQSRRFSSGTMTHQSASTTNGTSFITLVEVAA